MSLPAHGEKEVLGAGESMSQLFRFVVSEPRNDARAGCLRNAAHHAAVAVEPVVASTCGW